MSLRVLSGQALRQWRLVCVKRRTCYRELASLLHRKTLPTSSSTADSRSRPTFTSEAQNDDGRFRESRGRRSEQTGESEGQLRKDGVVIERNVRYAKDHPRNVMDIYSPASSSGGVRPPVLLFVHGGMWLRGSKEQHSLSTYDVVSTMLASAYDQMIASDDITEEEAKQQDPTFSNVGLTVAGNGGVACIMNYRLAAQSSNNSKLMTDDVAHPHQVMDVARAIVFMVERELSQTGGNSPDAPNLYVGGHSAGAHLAALALSDSRYLHAVMDERGLDWGVLSQVLAGFIGISGVYNLRRLAMSPMADITVGPAFFRRDHRHGEEGFDMSLEASPVHAILRAQNFIHGGEMTQRNWVDEYPPLVGLPVLLLNAESDFHLHQDASELLVALQHFKDRQKPSTQSFDKKVEEAKSESNPIIIAGRNHLSIMREFGQGLLPFGDENSIADKGHMDTDVPPEHVSGDNKSSVPEGWTVNRLVNDSIDALSSTTSFLSSYVMHNDQPDDTASRVLEFLRLDPTSPRPPARK